MSDVPPGWTVYGNVDDIQTLYDIAVVMPSIGRASIEQAIRSIYDQNFSGRIQVLIGVDWAEGFYPNYHALFSAAPKNVTIFFFNPGYSTSVRHGGIHPARDGGSLRALLTYLANARYVAYLDDDNWWENNHLSEMYEAIQGKSWCFSRRWFVFEDSRAVAGEDTWESVGPGRGVFNRSFGGWVDPNCLMFDKIACEPAIRLWTIPLHGDAKAMSADRNIFSWLLSHEKPGETGIPTVYYVMQENDGLHQLRLEYLQREQKLPPAQEQLENLIAAPAEVSQNDVNLSIIITCRARLHHLKQTIGHLLGHAGVEVIVVDYSCPDGTATWLKKNHPSVKVVEFPSATSFHKAHACNLGASYAVADRLMFVDADVFVGVDLIKFAQNCTDLSDVFYVRRDDPEAYGTFVCPKNFFELIGGFDEAMQGWGGEDFDLYFRLAREGCAERAYPAGLTRVIRHSDAERDLAAVGGRLLRQHQIHQCYLGMLWDLEALRKSRLGLDERKTLWQAVMQAINIDREERHVSVMLGEHLSLAKFMGWQATRELTYRIQPTEPS